MRLSALLVLVACSAAEDDTTPVAAYTMNPVVDDRAGGALLSIWSNRAGGEPVWFVGGTSDQSLVLEFDGTAWKTHDPGLGHRLWWVTGFGDELIVVGEAGVIARKQGDTWSPMEGGPPGTVFYGVWGSAKDDLWAVGGPWNDAPEGVTREGDVIMHYDGAAWTRVRVPELDAKPDSAQKELFKVWGTGKDHAIIVGSSGLALHWDGASWTRHDTGDTAGPLFTVTGRAHDDAWAIGGFNESRLVHWDGATWTAVPTGEFAATLTQGVFTAPGLPVYTTGIGGYLARYADDAWSEPDPVSLAGYHAVWVDGDGTVWAAGGDITNRNASLGAIAVSRDDIPLP